MDLVAALPLPFLQTVGVFSTQTAIMSTSLTVRHVQGPTDRQLCTERQQNKLHTGLYSYSLID